MSLLSNISTGKPPLLFIHGWGLSARSYLPALTCLTSWFSVYTPSLPGFGDSAPLPRGTPVGLEEYSSAILNVWELANLPSPVPIVAHSMGSGVAVKMALARPDLVSSLILICPVGGGSGGSTSWRKLASSLMKEMNLGFTPRFWDAAPSMFRYPDAAIKSAFTARNANLSNDLYTLLKSGLNISLVFADDDGVVRPGNMPFTGCRVVDVPGGHGWLLRDPRRFGDLVHAELSAIS